MRSSSIRLLIFKHAHRKDTWDLIKLENTMITTEGNLKFIDFGSYFNEDAVRYVPDQNLGLAWDVSIGCLGDLLHQAKMILEPFQESIKTPFMNRLFKELNWVSVNPSNPNANLDQILDQVGDMFNVGDQDALPDFSAIFQTLAPPQRPALRELPPLKNGKVMQDRKEHLLSFLKELIDDPELAGSKVI
jgi:hypothetical protein